jgi:hypothetical protein
LGEFAWNTTPNTLSLALRMQGNRDNDSQIIIEETRILARGVRAMTRLYPGRYSHWPTKKIVQDFSLFPLIRAFFQKNRFFLRNGWPFAASLQPLTRHIVLESEIISEMNITLANSE